MLFGFDDWLHISAASMVPYGQLFCVPGLTPPECMIVVDTGFSFTHVVPMIDGRVIWSAVKRWANLCSEGYLIKGHLLLAIYFISRLDVGGKLLTNQLKELISYRQWNMMDETYIMNDVKESCCFVSSNYKDDLETCR